MKCYRGRGELYGAYDRIITNIKLAYPDIKDIPGSIAKGYISLLLKLVTVRKLSSRDMIMVSGDRGLYHIEAIRVWTPLKVDIPNTKIVSWINLFCSVCGISGNGGVRSMERRGVCFKSFDYRVILNYNPYLYNDELLDYLYTGKFIKI